MVPVQGFFKFTLELLIHKWCVGTVDHIRNTQEKQQSVDHNGDHGMTPDQLLKLLIQTWSAGYTGNDKKDQA